MKCLPGIPNSIAHEYLEEMKAYHYNENIVIEIAKVDYPVYRTYPEYTVLILRYKSKEKKAKITWGLEGRSDIIGYFEKWEKGRVKQEWVLDQSHYYYTLGVLIEGHVWDRTITDIKNTITCRDMDWVDYDMDVVYAGLCKNRLTLLKKYRDYFAVMGYGLTGDSEKKYGFTYHACKEVTVKR